MDKRNISREEIEKKIAKENKQVTFFTAEFTVELLVSKIDTQELEVPDYQRNFVWEEKRQSRFIESLLMGLPIPFLFFWEIPKTGKLEIVDGVQRLKTLSAFINGNLTLSGLEKLTFLNGYGWEALLESRKRKFNHKTIRANILGEHVNTSTRRDMFERINTGSLQATEAEIRRGAFEGPFMKMIIHLAKNDKFKKLAPLSDRKQASKADQELVTRFFAYGLNFSEYKNSPREFLADYMKKMNDEFSTERHLRKNFEKKFHDVMDFVEKNFPNGFCKPKKNYTSNAYFEAIAVGTLLALQEVRNLSSVTDKSLHISRWIEGKEFTRIVSADGANSKGKVNARINYVKNKILEDLKA